MSTLTTRLAGIALAALLTAAVPGQAQNHHYRWVDEQGKTVYSDRPPPGGQDYEIVSSTSNFSRAIAGREGAMRADDAVDDGSEADPAREKLSEQERRKADYCAKARANLEVLKGTGKIVVRGADGVPRTLSAEEIEQQRQTARSQVTAYCE